MEKNNTVQIYYGSGHGKTTAALGTALFEAAQGKQVIVIQFLKGKRTSDGEYLKRLEPEIKFFNFSRFNLEFAELTEEQKQEEINNLRNAFHYSRKVISTGACDLLILDELLGVEDVGGITGDEIDELLEMKPEDMGIILTGRSLDDKIRDFADKIYNIESEK